jgi:hemolysin III
MEWLHFREPVSAWTHGIGFVLALPASVLLWQAGRGDRVKQFSFLVFGLSLAACYAGSLLYHAVRLPPELIRWFATADSIGIYLLIAGSITPFAVVALQGPWQWGTVVTTWMLAGCGCALCLLFSHVPGVVSTSIYLGMGWGILACRSQFEQSPKPIDLRLAFLGGVLYSAGAMFNLLHWPVLWPGVFAAHELFHLFVMAGSLAHFWFMLTVVAPLERPLPNSRRTRSPVFNSLAGSG